MEVEITELELADGVDEAEFLEADRRAQQELYPFLSGFVRRTTARGPSRGWVVIVLWGSKEEAEAAAAEVESHPATRQLLALAVPGSVRVRRYTTLD